MSMTWADASEIVIGLVITKKISINSVRPEIFVPPYNDVIKLMKTGTIDTETLIEKIGFSPIQASLEAAKSVNGMGSGNWIKILEDTAIAYDAGIRLEKFGKKLQQGEPIDWATIKTISHQALEGVGGDFIPLSDIEAGEIPFKETGFKAIDEHLGGLPIVGQVIIAAPSGAGKTTFMVGLTSCWVKRHPEDVVAVFTLEMMKEEIAMRFNEVAVKLTDEERERIHISDEVLTPEEVINKASMVDHLGLVCIDFADLLIKGETTESTMAHIYRTFMLGAKQLGCPVVLLSQLNRGYSGGVPAPNDIRYTGLAEALGWMVLMLYNPETDWFGEEDTENYNLPFRKGHAYVLCWKVRGGFRKHKEDSPGAIQLEFKGSIGWRTDDIGHWFSLRKLSSGKIKK
jgi:hypothetical protein